MAKRTADGIYIDTDFERVFHIKNEAETASINITGWALSWMVKRSRHDADADAVLTKTTGGGAIVVAGSYNADPSLNAQRATLTVADTDVDTEIPENMYHWELKRTDAGAETVLAYGTFEVTKGVHD